MSKATVIALVSKEAIKYIFKPLGLAFWRKLYRDAVEREKQRNEKSDD